MSISIKFGFVKYGDLGLSLYKSWTCVPNIWHLRWDVIPTAFVADTMDEQKSVDDSIEEKLKLLILERDDTLHILRNDNLNEIKAQTKFYEETLN